MDTTPVTLPDIEQHALTLVQEAQILQVAAPADLTRAAAVRTRLKATLKAAAEFFDPLGQRLDAAKAEFLAGRRRIETPLKSALTALDGQIAAYLDLARAEREREEAVLTEAAKAQAETVQVEQAAALERLGQPAAAEQVLASPILAPPVILPPPAAPGLASRTDWKFEVMDAALVPREYLVIDLVKLGGVVRALKGQTAIPGIRVYPKTVPLTSRI